MREENLSSQLRHGSPTSQLRHPWFLWQQHPDITNKNRKQNSLMLPILVSGFCEDRRWETRSKYRD
jgi:hypothetical protein